MKKPLVIVTGPTASGKTSVSVELAKRINGEIISADSMQVYKHMDIGTAKVTKEEMQGVPHYLIDEITPDTNFDVTEFQALARKYINQIHERGKIPILAGGTGFYIQAILYGIDFTESEEDHEYRKELFLIAEKEGVEVLHKMLQEVDPESGEKIHANNIKRVVRALEYYKQTGEKISIHNKEQRENESPYDFVYFVIHHEREILYDRINKRVDQMIEEGLIEETKKLMEYGCTSENTSMKAIGYKEIIPYIEGQSSLEESISKLKQNTRNFAKRQMTWFRREKTVTWINSNDFKNQDEILNKMIKILEEEIL